MYKEPSHTIYLYSNETVSEKPYVFDISFETKDETEVYERIPEFKTEFTLQSGLKHGLAKTFRSKEIEKFPEFIGIYNPPVGGRYIVRGLNYRVNSSSCCQYIDPIIADYLAMYILSMCVRYKQELWGDTIQGEKSGIIPLIELYLSIVKRRFPNGILNRIFGIDFWYGSPSYLM